MNDELKAPILLPASRDELVLASLEKILRQLMMITSHLEILNNQVAHIGAKLPEPQSLQ